MTSDFGLYRESLGKYLFDGRPEIYFNARLALPERMLLEVHEHNHWMLANATTYGKEQLALADAVRIEAQQGVAAELQRCLEVTVDYSQLVYEGSALAAERSSLQSVGLSTSPDWFSLLKTDLYAEAQRLFDSWLHLLPYSPEVLLSIAANVAELCLNCVSILDATKSDQDPISARDPMTLRAEDLRVLLRTRSPDSLLQSLSGQLMEHSGAFVQRLDDRAGEVLSGGGLTAEALRTHGALSGIDTITDARLTYAIYEALRGFAEETGAIGDSEEYSLSQTLFEYRLADWLTRLHANDMPGEFQAGGVRVGSPSEEEIHSEQEFFERIYTAVRPPERDRATNLPITSWDPVHEAFRAVDPSRRMLYLAITTRPSAVRETSAAEASFEISAARAVMSPHDSFGWKFGSSRYALEVPSSRLREKIEEVLPYYPAVAIPFELMDFPAGGIRGVGPLPHDATLGILLDNVAVQTWASQIERVSRLVQTMSHYYEIGPAQVPFIVTFGIVETAQWFLYAPLSLSMRRAIDSASLMEIAGHQPARTLDEIPMTARFQAASFLICEQYTLNGF